MKKMLRTVAAMAGLLLPLTGLGLSGVAEAQTTTQYPPAAQSVTVSRSQVAAGEPVVVSGTGRPNDRVDFTLVLGTTIARSVALGSATTNATGFYRAAVTIPCETPSGDHTLRTSGAANASTNLTVSGVAQVCPDAAATTAGVGTTGGGLLPRTGSSSTAPLVAAGAGLVLIGAATAITARRRRTAESA